MTSFSNRNANGLQDLPFIFPEANLIDERYFVYDLLNKSGSPMWDGTQVLLPPTFAWGNRVTNAPPSFGFPSQNVASTTDISISVTKVWGRHTLKSGFYNQHSDKQQVQGGAAGGPALNFQQDAVGTNPCDTSFGFANAAIGCFSSYSQGSKGVEGQYVYDNTEAYIQDNWKVNSKLTLDYGVRFVHQSPQYDKRGQASNFFTDQWAMATGAGAVCGGLFQWRVPVHRHQPPGDEPVDRPVPWPEHDARDRDHRPEFREPDEWARPSRPGHPDRRRTSSPRSGSRLDSAWRMT